MLSGDWVTSYLNTYSSNYLKNRRFFIMFEDVKELKVWNKAHELALLVYALTSKFPRYELVGLTSQIRRAAVSIPSNIVEGRGRGSKKDYKRFLYISRGSLEEVKYQLLLAKDLGYIELNQFEVASVLAIEVGKLLNGLIKYLKE